MRELEGTFIGFCGAGGTGKTTTANRLATFLPNYSLLTSVSRTVFERHGVASEAAQNSMTPEDRWTLQQDIQLTHMVECNKRRGKKVICDRTQMDQFAYALNYCHMVMDEEAVQKLQTFVDRALGHYQAIFYFPLVTFDSHADGMRTNHPGSRILFDRTLRGIIQAGDVPVIEVPVKSVDGRCSFIINHLIDEELEIT